MGGSNFDLIAQELLRHKQIMEEMEAENRWLREELANLRAGRGIFLEIDGKRIALDMVTGSSSQPAQSVQPVQPVAQPAPSTLQVKAEEASVPDRRRPARTRRTTMPLPAQEVQQEERASFLEEIMLDEFSTALTSPTAVWQGPATPAMTAMQQESPKKQGERDEDEMAALRRELMGSFLLE
ncbi:MAG: hypothetical protein NVS4B9_07040 [Ktedonobacteraceae bacterium]